MTTIVRDDAIRSGDPRIEGTRITVLDIKRRVIDGDEDPFEIATEYDLDVAAVFTALAYYYEHVEAMRDRESEREERLQEIRRQSTQLREQAETDELAEQ